MLSIESAHASVSHSAETVYQFLIDLNNLEKLMPTEKVEYWKSTASTCRFGIKNLASIGMKIKEGISPYKIILEADGNNPFPFTLTIFIKSADGITDTHFVFEGEVNMFMKTMVQKPLQKFFDALAQNLPQALG